MAWTTSCGVGNAGTPAAQAGLLAVVNTDARQPGEGDADPSTVDDYADFTEDRITV